MRQHFSGFSVGSLTRYCCRTLTGISSDINYDALNSSGDQQSTSGFPFVDDNGKKCTLAFRRLSFSAWLLRVSPLRRRYSDMTYYELTKTIDCEPRSTRRICHFGFDQRGGGKGRTMARPDLG